MQIQGMQGMRWKELAGSKTDRSFADSRSRSKNKKYTPTRSGLVSQLSQKIKSGNDSQLNNSYNQSIAKEKQGSYIERESISKNTQTGQYKQKYSPTKSQDSQGFDLRRRIKPVLSINQELASPTIIMKQLNKLKKTQNQREQNIPTKALFSLDQQHQYIQEQLYKIKLQYKKFKQLVQSQLTKQLLYVKTIVQKIYAQFQRVLQTCGKSTEGFNFIQHTNIQKRDSSSFQPAGMPSPDVSAIQKINSLNQSKSDIKKLLQEQGMKLDRAIIQRISQNFQSHQINKNYDKKQSDTIADNFNTLKKMKSSDIKSNNQSDKFQAQNIIQPNINSGLGRKSSKKQFQKLFQAVNCLKNDIKDLKGLSNSIKKDGIVEYKPKQNQIHSSLAQSRGKSKTISSLRIGVTKETSKKEK